MIPKIILAMYGLNLLTMIDLMFQQLNIFAILRMKPFNQ